MHLLAACLLGTQAHPSETNIGVNLASSLAIDTHFKMNCVPMANVSEQSYTEWWWHGNTLRQHRLSDGDVLGAPGCGGGTQAASKNQEGHVNPLSLGLLLSIFSAEVSLGLTFTSSQIHNDDLAGEISVCGTGRLLSPKCGINRLQACHTEHKH